MYLEEVAGAMDIEIGLSYQKWNRLVIVNTSDAELLERMILLVKESFPELGIRKFRLRYNYGGTNFYVATNEDVLRALARPLQASLMHTFEVAVFEQDNKPRTLGGKVLLFGSYFGYFLVGMAGPVALIVAFVTSHTWCHAWCQYLCHTATIVSGTAATVVSTLVIVSQVHGLTRWVLKSLGINYEDVAKHTHRLVKAGSGQFQSQNARVVRVVPVTATQMHVAEKDEETGSAPPGAMGVRADAAGSELQVYSIEEEDQLVAWTDS